jgi:uncharacterized protein (TIGR03083 family)
MTDDLMPLVAAEYERLHAAVSLLSEPAWDGPTLCEGWTVRHVVAHLTMPVRYTPEEFGAELAAVQFDFATLSNQVAERDAGLPVATLLDGLASETLAEWVTPGGGPTGSLSHVVIHGLDITVPAGLGSVGSDAALRVVLDHLAAGGGHRHFGTSLEGRSLAATDLDWSHGTGEPETAPAHELVLALAGRDVTLG